MIIMQHWNILLSLKTWTNKSHDEEDLCVDCQKSLDKTMKNTNIGGQHMKSRWMDFAWGVELCRWRRCHPDAMISEAVLILRGGVRVQRQMSVFRRFGSLPFSSNKTLSLICFHLHLCLHLNDHLLHASQLQRKREKK